MKKIFIILLFSCFTGKTFSQNYTVTTGLPLSEIAGTGTAVTMTNTASSAALPIGFSFNFWGTAYTDFYINPTGAIQFGAGSSIFPRLSPNNFVISSNTPNNFLAFGWVTGTSNFTNANINYFVSGVSPNRILILNFKNVVQSGYQTQTTINVQIQLYEGIDGKIEIHNTNNAAVSNGGIFMEKQIGIENLDGTKGVDITNISNWNVSNSMIKMVYCVSPPDAPTSVTPATNLCAGGNPITLSASCSTGSPVWYTGYAIKTILANTTVSPTTYTFYSVRCETGGVPNCTSSFVSTTINPVASPPAPTLTRSPTTDIVLGNPVTVNAAGCTFSTINWSDGTSQVNNTSFAVSKIFYPNINTTYTATCTNSGCTSILSNALLVNIITPPTLIASLNPICLGTSTTLTAGNCAGTLTWNNSLGTGTSKTVNPTTFTNYTVTCSTTSLTKTLGINVIATPTAPTSITKNPTTPVNPNASVLLTAVGCVSGNTTKWNDNSTINPRTVNPAATTTYTAKCVNTTCESTTAASVTVDVNGPPVITATQSTVCQNVGVFSNGINIVSTTLTATGCTGSVAWSSIPTNAPKPSGNSGIIYSSDLTGNVTYTAFCAASGFTSTGFLLTYIPKENDIITANPIQITSEGQTVALSNSNTSGTFTWIANRQLSVGFDNSTQIGTGTSINHTPISTTEYRVTTVVSGCTFTSTVVKVPFRLTVSGTGNINLDKPFNEGCERYIVADGGSGTPALICPPRTADVGTSYFNQGLTTFTCGYYNTCARAYFIVRKNNIWEIWDTQAGNQNTNVSQRLYHTKFNYDTNRPPCSAIWIKDADGSEVILSNTGLCENVDNTITSITTPATICAGQSMPVNFTTSTAAASYTIELLWDYSYQFLCGGPSGESTTLLNSITTTTNSASIPVQGGAGIGLDLDPSGCRTGGGCGGQNRCDNYRVRVTPVGSTQGVSQSFTINGSVSPTAMLNTSQTGNWNTVTTWQCGAIPTATNAVQIQSGHIVDINSDVHAKSVKFLGTGKLNYTGTAGKLNLNQ